MKFLTRLHTRLTTREEGESTLITILVILAIVAVAIYLLQGRR